MKKSRAINSSSIFKKKPEIIYSVEKITSYVPTKHSIHEPINAIALDLYSKWIISIPLEGYTKDELSIQIKERQLCVIGSVKLLNEAPLQVKFKEFNFKALLPYYVNPMVIWFRYFDSMIKITIPKQQSNSI